MFQEFEPSSQIRPRPRIHNDILTSPDSQVGSNFGYYDQEPILQVDVGVKLFVRVFVCVLRVISIVGRGPMVHQSEVGRREQVLQGRLHLRRSAWAGPG